MPVPAATWAPDPDVLAGLGPAGRRLVDDWLGRYDFSPAEGAVLVELAHVADRLAGCRVEWAGELEPTTRASVERREQGWVRLFTSLVGLLKVTNR